MTRSPFDRLTTAAAFYSISIWLFFLFLGPRLSWETMDQFLVLHRHPLFALRGILGTTCFMTSMIAMAGLCERLHDRVPGLPRLAFALFAVGTAVDCVYRSLETITVQTVWARKALAATDAAERSAYLARIELFRDVGEGVFVVFGLFFVLAYLAFGLSCWWADRTLASALLATGAFMATLYGAAFFDVAAPRGAWIAYDLLMILLYLRLGWFLLWPRPS